MHLFKYKIVIDNGCEYFRNSGWDVYVDNVIFTDFYLILVFFFKTLYIYVDFFGSSFEFAKGNTYESWYDLEMYQLRRSPLLCFMYLLNRIKYIQ